MKQLHAGLVRSGHRSRIFIGENVESDVPRYVTHLYPRLLHRLYHTRLNGWIRKFAPIRPTVDRRMLALSGAKWDLVHVHNFHGIYATSSALVSLTQKIPVLWTLHGFWSVTGGCDTPGVCQRYMEQCGSCPRVHEWPINGVDNTAEELRHKKQNFAKAAITVVSPSEHLAKVVRASPVGCNWPIQIIPNGVDPEEFRPFEGDRAAARQKFGLEPDKTTIIAVSRSYTDPHKGGAILADAIARLDLSVCQVVLVGAGTEALQERVGAKSGLICLGYVADRQRLASLLSLADIFLFASPAENFPCVTLEAMASGCAVISTPTQGVIEQITDRKDGFFSSELNGASLAATVQMLLQRQNLLREVGNAARQRVIQSFSEKVMFDRYSSLYQEIVSKTSGRNSDTCP